MIGKSYDGTLANGVAATGVEGLKTIVPISAISSWYDYTRSNGVVTRGDSYPSSLANTVTDPAAAPYCAAVRDRRWPRRRRRDRRLHAVLGRARLPARTLDKVEASVFVVHGLQDDNVMPNHFSEVVGRARRERRAAQALADADRPRRPVRLPPRGVG